MEIQIKKTVKAGNSSAVVLPKSWLNQNVRVELIKKTPEIMLLDVIEILKKNIKLKNIIGIYLAGSYARGEENENSDIDILVITNEIDKEMIYEGIYNILIISKQLLKYKLEQDLFPIGQMIREAKPLLNSDYLNLIDVKITRKNIKWYLNTTEDKLKLIKKILDKTKTKSKNIDNRIVYTLILRIRTLHIIKKLIKKKNYSKNDFVRVIEGISKGSYKRYLVVKNDLKGMGDGQGADKREVEKLYEYLKKELKIVRGLVG